MADHPMLFTEEIPTRGTNAGWKLFIVEQATAAALAENDTLTFPNIAIADIRILSMRGDTGQVVNFDTKAASGANARFTVDHQDAASSKFVFGTLATGAIATSCQGMVLARRN